MPLIDDRGRLFGKLNLIDAIVGIVALGLIPLAYGAFLLFRVPAPTITSLAPAQVIAHAGGTVQVTGTDLRPFLTATIGTTAAPGFLVQSPTLAEIKLPDLPPGSYDLTLADQAQTLVVKPAALTVVPAPAPPPTAFVDLQAVGAFIDVTKEDAASIVTGSRFPPAQSGVVSSPLAEVLVVRPLEPGSARVRMGPNVFVAPVSGLSRLPAILRLQCIVVNLDCTIGGTVVAQNASISLPWPRPPAEAPPAAAGRDHVTFVIDEIRPDGMRAPFPAVATVRVRFVAGPEVLAVLKAGDTDVSDAGLALRANGAVLRDLGSDRQTVVGSVNNESFLRRSYSLDQTFIAFTATVGVPVVWMPSGWSYNQRPVKVGAPFTFESVAGAMYGWILGVKIDEETTRSGR